MLDKKLIYISGIGRSGSTLLDMIISTSDEVFSIGEIYRYNEIKKNNMRCGCGEAYSNCDFWQKFEEKNSNIKIYNHVNFKEYLNILNFLYNPFVRNKYPLKKKSENNLLLKEVSKLISNKNVKYILDSSKEVGRLIELGEDKNIDLYVINVVRDGRAVANSFNSKIQDRPGKNYFISLFKWILMNTLIFRYLNKAKIKHINISYDRFCQNPQSVLREIEDFLNTKIPNNYADVVKKMQYHIIGGNRLSFPENRKKFDGIRVDIKWKEQQVAITKFLATLITYFFNKAWVYTKDAK